MLSYDDALSLEYYKKTSYTGWMEGMRFLIKKEQEEESDPILHGWIWPGPYIFDKTEDSSKEDHIEPFTEEGRKAMVDWVNGMFEDPSRKWSKRKIPFEYQDIKEKGEETE